MKGAIRSILGRHPRLFLSAAILIVALFARIMPMGRYVTPDEPIWVMRSLQFLDAVHARSWFEIPQTGHPGLTTMVIGATGIQITRWLNPTGTVEHLNWLRNLVWLAPENAEAIRRLVVFLPAARGLVAVIQSIGLVVVYGAGCNRLGERPARWLAVFLALDPFLIGHAGLLHTDALQATFVLLAVLLAMPPASLQTRGLLGLSRRRERWLAVILAGFCLALAGLTKLLGFLIAPSLALALVIGERSQGLRRWLLVGLLALSSVIFSFALYPPFWVHPRAAVDVLLDAIGYHEGIGLRDTFFAGRMTVDPGPWFYPVVLLFRLSPPALIGLILGGLWPQKRSPALAGWFLLPAAGYLTVLTVVTKKFDRYALTPLVLLTAMAALHWSRHRLGKLGRQVQVASLLIPWVVVALLPLYYADPFLGGPWVAHRVIPLGWGEGSSFAARKAARDAGSDAILLADNVPGAAPFFPGVVRSLEGTPIGCADVVIVGTSSEDPRWKLQDTVRLAGLPLATVNTPSVLALEVSDTSEDVPYLLPGRLPGFDEAASDVFVAPLTDTLHLHRWISETVGAVDAFVWVRAPACYPLADAQIASLVESEVGFLDCTPVGRSSAFDADRCLWGEWKKAPTPWIARFSQGMDLIAAPVPDDVRAPEALGVRMRWLPRVPVSNLELYLALRDPETGLTWSEGGRVAVGEQGWRSSAWRPHQTADSAAYVPISRSLPPATYEIVLRVSEMGGGWLGFTRPDGSFGGTELSLGSVDVLPPFNSAGPLDLPVEIDVDLLGVKILSGSLDRETVWAGDRLPFRLEVMRTGASAVFPPSWGLVCGGETRDGGPLHGVPGDPLDWPEGFRFTLRYALHLDPALADGTCDLRLTATSGSYISLGEVTVRARSRSFSLPKSPQFTLDAEVGEFGRLVGADLPADIPQAGQPLTVTLYWEASRPADRDYTVFVHLSDALGIVWAQSDAQPAQGRAPTSSWIDGQVIVDRHSLVLPELAPPGGYTLWAGMYAPETGYRLPLHQKGARLPDDRVRLRDWTLR